MGTLIRKCTYKEFRQNKRCKFCDYFQKTESMIDSDNSFFAFNGFCHMFKDDLHLPGRVKSSEICRFLIRKGFKAYSKPEDSVPLQMPD